MIFFDFINKYKYVISIALLLFIIPFFWLKPGEMDVGGDHNRLFFYDPITYLKNFSPYAFRTEGMGIVESWSFEIPLIGFIAFLKFLVPSPTFAISFINGLKLAGAFFTIYLLTCEFIQQIYSKNNKNTEIAAILAGIFYVVSLGSIHINSEWTTALVTHNQVFLNPLMFYLLFKFLLTKRYTYLWITLLLSFIFSYNFSYDGTPPFFAFYPIALLFLCLYVRVFLNKSIPWKGLGIGLFLFFCLQAFHFFGQLFNLFDSSSYINSRVFNPAKTEGMNYFTAVAPSGMVVLNLLLPSENFFFRWLSFLSPIILIIGFILNKKKEFLFISLFFMLTFFLATANITNVGFELYKNLFTIPAMSMFRIFFVKWMYLFLFFYSLLFGLSIYVILLQLKTCYKKILYLSIFILLVIAGIPLLIGEPVNKAIVRGSNNVRSVIRMDPRYEQTLQFIRSLPDDGKFLMLPLTDFNFEVIYGKEGGVYAGVPVMAHLTQKYGFYGDRDFGWRSSDPVKYAEDIKKYAREKNYDRLLHIFTTLNIRYIYHNADPNIYETKFSDGGPWYFYIKNSLPNTQKGYTDFIRHFPVRTIYKNGSYNIYKLDNSVYNPTIFIPKGVYQSDRLSFDKDKIHSVFIDTRICNKGELKELCKNGYKPSSVDTNFRMINPTSYEVTVRREQPIKSILLVMQHTFHHGWKLIIDGREIPENQHITVNGYANGWLLTEKDISAKKSYNLSIQFDPQKYFWYGWIITGASLIVVLWLLIISLIKKNENN